MQMDRRQFLVTGLVSPLLPGVRLTPAQLIDRGFARVTAIAEGVYATIANPANGLQCYSNGGIIVGDDALLIVEGHFKPAGAELEIEVARRLSRAPIAGVVNTHYHLDHTFGNAGYVRQRIPIFAHERVGPLMRERFAKLKGTDRAAFLAFWKNRLTAATDAEERSRKAGDLRLMEWMFDAINSAELAFPTDPLAAAELPKRIDLGGLTAVVEFHPGHSPTDVIVRVLERDVVFAGDLLFTREYPVVADANILQWRRVLDRLAGLGQRTRFVPGHGPVGSIRELREQSVLMDHLHEYAEKMLRSGATPEEAESRYQIPERFRQHRMLSWATTIGGAMRSFFAALNSSR